MATRCRFFFLPQVLIASLQVLQVFHSAGKDIRARVLHPVPQKSLRDFERVSVAAGESQKIAFSLVKSDFVALVNTQGEKQVYSGQHNIIVSNGNVQQDIVFSEIL